MTCIFCGKELEIITRQLRNKVGNVFYCKDCDLGILEEPVPDPEKYYAEEYRKTHRNDPCEETPEQIYENTKNFQQIRVNRVNFFAKQPGDLLEIGCSAGQFLSQINRHRLFGVEYDEGCRNFVKERFELQVFDLFPAWETYDYVAMFQVLEHIQDPISYLKDIFKVMKPGGLLFVEVPNINDHLRAIPAYNKFYFHEAHNWYFSEKSLQNLAEKSGFSIKYLEFIQDYGIKNYYHWLFKGTPIGIIGLMPEKEEMFKELDNTYRNYLCCNGVASNIFAVLEKS